MRLLTDRDIGVVRDVLRQADGWVLSRTADKIKEVTGVESSLDSQAFLETVLDDYQFITTQ